MKDDTKLIDKVEASLILSAIAGAVMGVVIAVLLFLFVRF
jgi:hypothetical protein